MQQCVYRYLAVIYMTSRQSLHQSNEQNICVGISFVPELNTSNAYDIRRGGKCCPELYIVKKTCTKEEEEKCE